MFFEVTLFNSLFKSNKWIWLFGWVFHLALLFVLLRHLRYFTDPVWFWVELIQPIAMDKGLRFAIREGGRTVGAGTVVEIIE